MSLIFLIVLCVLAGALVWIGWELRAVRRTLQVRCKEKGSVLEIMKNTLANLESRKNILQDQVNKPF